MQRFGGLVMGNVNHAVHQSKPSTTMMKSTHHMSRTINGGHSQNPGRLGFPYRLPPHDPVTPRVSQILPLAAPFQTFHPEFVGAGVALPIISSEINQNTNSPLMTVANMYLFRLTDK